jgi:hypothetical protein
MFASSMPPEGSAAFAPPNIGGVSEGRGGFAALRISHAYPSASLYSFQSLTYIDFSIISFAKFSPK